MGAEVRRWWLSLQGKVDGPRSQVYVMTALQTGQLASSVQACPEGATEWRPLGSWPEFQAYVSSIPNSPHPSPAYRASNDRLLTNPQLPAMANAICGFTIVLLPQYWLVGAMLSVVTLKSVGSDSDVALFFYALLISGPISLAITILLAIGGMRLRDLRWSGVRLVRVGLIIDLIFTCVNFVLVLVMLMGFLANDQMGDSSSSGVLTLLILMESVAGISALVFEAIALYWLFHHTSQLPLDGNR